MVEGGIDLRRLRYVDPTGSPRFVEDRSPVQCSVCSNVPRNPKDLVDGRCRGKVNCANRAAGR